VKGMDQAFNWGVCVGFCTSCPQ